MTLVEELGSDAFVYDTTGGSTIPYDITIRVRARDTVRKGDIIHVATDPHHVHVFDTDTGARLSE